MHKGKRSIDGINNPTSTAITFRLAFLFTEYRVIRKPLEYSLAKKLLCLSVRYRHKTAVSLLTRFRILAKILQRYLAGVACDVHGKLE